MTHNPQSQLWTHQETGLTKARHSFGTGSRCVLIQLPTGTGKTKMVVSGINGAITKPSKVQPTTGGEKLQTVAFVVPRRELLWQSGKELKDWGIDHKIVDKTDSPNLFNVHIWCAPTFLKRIRNLVKHTNKEPYTGEILTQWPDFIIVDEAHLNLAMWLEIKAAAPPHVKFLGVTATPERLDYGDLSKMWDVMIEGDQLAYFVENGFLKRPWVLSVPQHDRLEGLDALKRNAAGDVNAADLAALYKARAKGKKVVYGDEIAHYKKYGQKRSYLIFCRSLVQAEDVAREFSASGYLTESIDGTMTDRQRKEKIDKVKSGELLGMTTVDLCAYGLDIPKISCLIMLRPTDSVALFFQMIGRGLRFDGIWENCLILDHVGNCDIKKHGHPLEPRTWNWTGTKRKKPPENVVELVAAVDKCPVCYDLMITRHKCKCGKIFDGEKCECGLSKYTTVVACRTCGAMKIAKQRGELKQIDGFLVEIQPGEQLPIGERLPENQRKWQDRINSAITKFRVDWYASNISKGGVINEQAVQDLIIIAHELKWKQPQRQVYYKLSLPDDKIVNTALLTVIAYIQVDGVKKRYHEKWVTSESEFVEIQLLKRLAG